MMKDGLSVAVIIPCFNREKCIRETIDSVLNQTYKPIEIIAIDDGSTDNTRKILESYSPKIRILSHPHNENCGEAASLNLGIRNSSADLISLLDSDDLFKYDKLKKQVEIFEQYPDIGVVYTNGFAIDNNNINLYPLFSASFREDNIVGVLLLNNYISAGSSTIMVRRELLNRVGHFRSYLRNASDHDMWIRLKEETSFYYIPEYLMAYRRHPNQQSLKRTQWEEGFFVLKDACDRYPYGFNLKRKRLAVLYYRLGQHDLRSKKLVRAIKNYCLAGMLDPLRAITFLLNKK